MKFVYVFWIGRLLNSPYVKRFLRKAKKGNFTDFANVCRVHYNNRTFRAWLKSIGCLEDEEDGRYTINGKKLIKYMAEDSLEMGQIKTDVEKLILDGFL